MIPQSPAARRLAQQLYDTWFEGDDDYRHAAYPDLVVAVDGRGRALEAVRYDPVANVVTLTCEADRP